MWHCALRRGQGSISKRRSDLVIALAGDEESAASVGESDVKGRAVLPIADAANRQRGLGRYGDQQRSGAGVASASVEDRRSAVGVHRVATIIEDIVEPGGEYETESD